MGRTVPFPRTRAAIGFMAAGACVCYALTSGRYVWLVPGALFVVAAASMIGWLGTPRVELISLARAAHFMSSSRLPPAGE